MAAVTVCTDLLWEVIGDVADFVAKKHPGGYITTLIYSPKRQVPARKLPHNVRVRLCLSGPKVQLTPKIYEQQLETIKTWHKVTGNKVPLWTYHCVGTLITMWPQSVPVFSFLSSLHLWL